MDPSLARFRSSPRQMSRVDDAVVLAEELLPGVLRDLAELVVHVGDDPALVGDGDDRGLVERVADLLEEPDRFPLRHQL
jgi:hypothetical protein